MEKSTKENQDSQENLGISAHLIMKSSATVERKVVWKQKLPAQLHRTLLERIKKGENSILSERINMENPLTLDEIIAAVNKEDVLCIEIVEEIGKN